MGYLTNKGRLTLIMLLNRSKMLHISISDLLALTTLKVLHVVYCHK